MKRTKYKLEELIIIQNGKDYRHLSNGNVPVYGTGGVMTYVDEFLYDGESVLLPRKGTLDNIMYVEGKFWTVDTMYWTKIDKTKVLPRFLYYYLKLLDLSCRDSGSTLPSMTFDSYYSLEIDIPEIEYQQKILTLIVPIDEKIKLNLKLSNELEKFIDDYFTRWFFQYDFPNDKGEPYKSSGGKMLFDSSLKKEIPSGWDVINIRQLCSLIWGQCPDGDNILPLNANGRDLLLYCSGAGDMRNGIVVDCQAKTNASRREAENGDILMSVAGSIGALCICDKHISLGRAAVAFRPKEGHIAFCFFMIKKYVNRMMSVSSGSIQKVINDTHIDDINFAYNEELVKNFGFVDVFLKKCMDISSENSNLRTIRDDLLPLLMNGQIILK